ncbi:E3 ubiquitin-protein ligase rad18 [Madurella fahalii]|uniref:Postreplication repair E3 ubiquitin-protein ligase RAD18 n=1 Tax=Madurella fahalii TaxID=1157608 RepID=A0ABQ0GG48_9PEZI
MDAFNSEAFDVPDSTDWLGTPLADLMSVEQAFRCHVCKDFYNSPMVTSCNHTFCSICIRRCLSVDGKCPLCRTLDQESKLRGNWALREAVDAFVKSRAALLQFARTAATAVKSSSPKRKATEMDGPGEAAQGNKRPRMTTRSSKAKAVEATAAIMREEVDVPESNDAANYEPEPEPDDGLVACPICWARMKPWQVDKHLDTSCPESPQPKNASTSTSSSRGGSSFGTGPMSSANSPARTKAPERLPALAYSMLKDTALRKKMTELGLSTSGPRQMLERRHQEWVTLWNANCDSARPKKRSELLHDLEVWERTVGTRAPTMSRAANMGAQIRDKDFDGAAWAVKHDSSFKDLIANARRSKSKVEQKSRENSLPEEGPKGPDSAQDHRTTATTPTAQPIPSFPRAAMDGLGEPPSSQSELPDSPSKSGGASTHESNNNVNILADPGVLLAKELPCLSRAGSISSPKEPNRAPS